MVSRTQEFLKISKEDDGPPVGAQAQQCTVNELARKMVDEYYPTPRGKGGVLGTCPRRPRGRHERTLLKEATSLKRRMFRATS